MHHRVEIPSKIREEIASLHPSLKREIRTALDDLAINPLAGKILKNELKGLRSRKVKRYRIVYEIVESEKTIRIVEIGHRSFVYKSVLFSYIDLS